MSNSTQAQPRFTTKKLDNGHVVIAPYIPEGEDVVVISADTMGNATTGLLRELEALSLVNDILKQTPFIKEGERLDHLNGPCGISGLHNIIDVLRDAMYENVAVLCKVEAERMEEELHESTQYIANDVASQK